MQNNSDVLNLFKGLDKEQVQQFKERIVPTLQELRREIVTSSTATKTEVKSDAMQSTIKKQR